MADKQIIIDGIEVSGCELYRDDNGVFAPDGTAERTELCYLTNDYCGNNPSCYYKQLKRAENQIVDLNKMVQAKEQECETLASQLDFEVQKKECLEQKCKQQSWDIGNLGYKIKNQRHEINNRLKQLDKLKADYEELKAEYTRVHTQLASQEAYILVDGEEVWSGSTRKLKQENDKLKAENAKLKYKAEFFENYNNAHIDKIMKLEQTITEIKEIANRIYSEVITENWQSLLAKQILQKISECEGE